MASYIISYDLRKDRDYEALYEAIKSYGTWAHITESTWAVTTSKSAVQVREHLSSVMDNDDRLFISKSGVEAAWINVICKSQWLKDNL